MSTINSLNFGTGTAGQVLTSNGAGLAPTFQTASSGTSTFHTGSGDATASGGAITIAGTSNQITTTGASSTVTISVPSAFTAPGSITATTTVTATSGAITATSGDVVITAGNLTLPQTTASGATGIMKSGGTRWLSQQPSSVGSDAVFIGLNAGNLAPGGGSSVNIGDVCIGTSAGLYNDSGASTTLNVAIGYQAMKGTTNRNKIRNVVIGGNAVTGDCSNMEANVFVGYYAGGALTNRPYRSVVIGAEALGQATGANSNDNILIGWRAGYAFTAGESDNIIIGYNLGTASDANTLRIGTSGTGSGQQSTCYIAGIAGVTVSSSATVLINTSTGQLGTVASSIRFKENINDMGDISSDVMKLRPVTFTYKNIKPEKRVLDFDPADPNLTDEQKKIMAELDSQKSEFINCQENPAQLHYGLIAEEVVEILPNMVVLDDEKKPASVKYHDLPVLLLNEIKKLVRRIEQLESKHTNDRSDDK